MGMFTECRAEVTIKGDAPKWLIDLLAGMVAGKIPESVRAEPGAVALARAFYGTGYLDERYLHEEWPHMERLLRHGNYLRDGKPDCRFVRHPGAYRGDEWHLSWSCNTKDGEEPWLVFLDFLAPYLLDEYSCARFLGTCRYEEADYPTLIYYYEGQIVWIEPERSPDYGDSFPKDRARGFFSYRFEGNDAEHSKPKTPHLEGAHEAGSKKGSG
jgi:hypothetical protein